MIKIKASVPKYQIRTKSRGCWVHSRVEKKKVQGNGIIFIQMSDSVVIMCVHRV